MQGDFRLPMMAQNDAVNYRAAPSFLNVELKEKPWRTVATQKNKTPNHMTKKLIKWAGAFVVLVGIAVTAYAASVHLKGRLTFTDNGTTATVCCSLAGLGNGDVTITLAGAGTTTVGCTNPDGHIAPGNAEEIAVTGTTSIPADQIKNGNVTFCVTTEAPTCDSARDCGCPNDNWSAAITDVSFGDMMMIVEQGGKVVLKTKVN